MSTLVSSDLTLVQQEKILSVVQKELARKTFMLPLTRNYTSMLGKGNTQVNVPRWGSFDSGISDHTEDSEITTSKLTTAEDTIVPSDYRALSFAITDLARAESFVSLLPTYTDRMTSAMARDLDTKAYEAAYAGVNAAHQLPDSTGADRISKEDILEMRKTLIKANADGQYWCVISPDTEAELLNIDNFIDASKYGSTEFIQRGEIGKIYGVRFIVNNVVPSTGTTDQHLMFTSDHLGWVHQLKPKFESKREPEYQRTRYVMAHRFGFGSLQDGVLAVSKAVDTTA